MGVAQPSPDVEPQPTSAQNRDRALSECLMEQVVNPANMNRAYARVRANKGSPGTDGMTVGQLAGCIREHKRSLTASLLDGSYQPQPVRGTQIPKTGGGMGQLGIPTVAERVMQSVTGFLEKRLRLRVNRGKSAVAPVVERKFLGHRLLPGGRLGIAPGSLERARERVRQITRRSRGAGFEQVIDELNQFFTGWVTYFRHAECVGHLRELDGWVRRKLRCLRLKQCRFMHPIARLLKKLGVPHRRAWLLAQSGRGWWRLSDSPDAHEGMSLAWFQSLGLVSLAARYEALKGWKKPPDTVSTSGGVGGRGPQGPLLPDSLCFAANVSRRLFIIMRMIPSLFSYREQACGKASPLSSVGAASGATICP